MRNADCSPSQDSDRRSAQRTTSVYRPVLVETEELAGFCLLRKISSGGMSGNFFTDFALGTPIRVHFNPMLMACGSVSWSEGGMIGIRFVEQIDVTNTLATISSSTFIGKANRAPRLKLRTIIKINFGNHEFPVEVLDISQKGMKVQSSYLKPTDEVTVLLDGLESKKAVVRWAHSGLAGINFLCPIEFSKLGNWVIAQQ